MHLNCPNCGAQITAENINVQQLVAVCAACDTVFPFKAPTDADDDKIKRRKVKQPRYMQVYEDDQLHLAFRTNFRLDKSEAFTTSAILSTVFTLMTILMTFLAFTEDAPFILPLIFGSVALGALYRLALVVYNRTHIDMDDDTITVSRKPLPAFIIQPQEVSLAGVTAITYEETPASQKEGYDTPRFRVWAERMDGSRRMIVNDVIEDYAIFITQCLDERLNRATEVEVSRLEDREPDSQHPHTVEDLLQATENS